MFTSTRHHSISPQRLGLVLHKTLHSSTKLPRSRSYPSVQTRTLATAPSTPTVKRPFTFHIGYNCVGKPLGRNEKPLSQPFPSDSKIGAWRDEMLVHKGKGRTKGTGEDFLYVQEMRNASGISFGVADGVGGWSLSGVDASLFSQSLMYHCHRYARHGWAGEPEIDPTLEYAEREQVEGWEITPQECMDLAHGGVLREKAVEAGSSTACIVTLNASSGLLRAANLGDSGFVIIRSSSLFYRQSVQTHFFNCPRQLAKLPSQGRKKFQQACNDFASDADKYQTVLRDGDLVIAYTDGFSDNVFMSDMLSICSLVSRLNLPEEDHPQAIADRLTAYAQHCMFQRSKPSPFQREAAREGMYFQGGKIDDVTIVVAMVRETT